MVYEPLYHAREIATINCFLVALEKEISKAYQFYLIVFNKIIIPLPFVGHGYVALAPFGFGLLSIISYPTRARGIIVN